MAHTPTIELNATMNELARVTAQAQVCVDKLQRLARKRRNTRARLQALEAEERRLIVRAAHLAMIQDGSGPAANTRAQRRQRSAELAGQLVEDQHAL